LPRQIRRKTLSDDDQRFSRNIVRQLTQKRGLSRSRKTSPILLQRHLQAVCDALTVELLVEEIAHDQVPEITSFSAKIATGHVSGLVNPSS
jgi:hypothetical protein